MKRQVRPPTTPTVSQRSSTTWLAPFVMGRGTRWHMTRRMALDKFPKEMVKYPRPREQDNVHSCRRVGGLVAIVGANCWRALPMKRDPRPFVQPVAGDTLIVIGNGHAIS